ncbi:LysR family transcriptional regulator [Nocardioides sp.]|uniref:LysR family transcriptional regulator n=1 Tax=Nocardioides sp. TaxID=35761 RepID=UPI00261DDC25|nr:LysR family transcriptional regulator [Nocardioides sp.]MCW2735754.1 putative LysR-family transcriptional regulator [Nocardioides sp.]
MELRTLRYFLAVADELHFGRAAARLHVAQSALSAQVKQLENEVGLVLLDRSTRHVELSEAGRRFREHALRITGAASNAEADMRALAQGLTGRVSVGFVGTATYDVLPQVARRVHDELPDVELVLRGELLSPELYAGIESGTFDLALLRPGAARDGVRLRPLRTERLVAALPSRHRLATGETVALADLASEAFVIHPSGDHSSMHDQVLAACGRAGFRPARLVEVGETATLVVFVAAGLGVALVPEPVRSLAVAGATYVQLADPETVDLALASRTGEPSAAAARVARIIGETVRD